MTNEIRFKTVQNAAKRIIAAQEKELKDFEDEHHAVRCVTMVLYIDKRKGKYSTCSAQAILRDNDMPTDLLIEIFTDQLLRLTGMQDFDERFRIEQGPDGRITGYVEKKDQGE